MTHQARVVALAGMLLAAFPVRGEPLSQAEASAAVAKYCATCHSPQLKTAGLVLNPAAAGHPQEEPETWENVIAKLRARSMPPPGAPRPTAETYTALQEYFEGEIDRAAAAHLNAGRLPLLHRLSRSEYANAVRDLLALDALPKEMDYSLLLPPDNKSSGFDNIADLMFTSPSAMESYLGAAEKISRLAIGDAAHPVMVNIHRMPDEQPQDARMDGLPVGTRGGMAIRSTFPLDGEYGIKVSLLGASAERQQLEITVDGERVQLAEIAPALRAGGPVAYRARAAEDAKPLEFRIPIKAGPHSIGVAFIERNELRDEEVLRPRLRSTGANLAVEVVTVSGPYNARGPGDTPSRRRIFVCRPASRPEEEPCARRILSAIERRAYRRPVAASDVESLMPFYKAGAGDCGFDCGIERALRRVLVSPQFLFRIEHDPAGATPGTSHPVSEIELASRLSFFIWSTIPDDELLDLASQGNLRKPGVLEQQVRRMLADQRSSSLVSNFAEQWLYLRDLESKKPNELLFPDFDESLRAAFRQETTLFVDSVLRGGGSVLDLLSANYTFVSERLAKHYGIPNIHGNDFRRVTFAAGDPRGGLLAQGSLLTITSYANRTSPVNRGKWVLENLLSAPPPPPPPNVPALKLEGSDPGKVLTMRDAMIQHRASPACASCHSRMDPIGFAMENFDAVGRWRDLDSGNAIDASGTFPDGTKFAGMAGLKAALLSHPEEFVLTIAERLLMYATGRNVQYFDQPALRAIARESARSNYTFASLILGVVRSAPFQMRETQTVQNRDVAQR